MATTHGHAGSRKNGKWVRFPSPTYVSWEGMNRRVTPVHTEHKHYKGIKICTRWKMFENFLADMGERPTGLSLDRINVSGDYRPDNCRWATWSQQSKNRKPFRRSDNRFLTYKGKTKTVPEWAREIGIRNQTLAARIKRGWSVQKALVCATRARRPVV